MTIGDHGHDHELVGSEVRASGGSGAIVLALSIAAIHFPRRPTVVGRRHITPFLEGHL